MELLLPLTPQVVDEEDKELAPVVVRATDLLSAVETLVIGVGCRELD